MRVTRQFWFLLTSDGADEWHLGGSSAEAQPKTLTEARQFASEWGLDQDTAGIVGLYKVQLELEEPELLIDFIAVADKVRLEDE
jgi:hypothetical protein